MRDSMRGTTVTTTFTLLGTGAAEGVPCYGCSCENCELAAKDPRYRRRQTANLLQVGDDFYLFDCGYDLVGAGTMGKDVPLRGIFLTHSHPDHILGLPSLLPGGRIPLYFAFPTSLHNDDPGLGMDMLRIIFGYAQRFDAGFELVELEDFQTLELGKLRVTPVKLHHPTSEPFRPGSSGFFVETPDGNIAYLVDTRGLPPETLEFFGRRRVDLAVVDATYPAGTEVQERGHNDVDEALAVLRALSPRVGVLTHIQHLNLPPAKLEEYVLRKSEGWGIEVKVGLDGMRLNLSPRKLSQEEILFDCLENT